MQKLFFQNAVDIPIFRACRARSKVAIIPLAQNSKYVLIEYMAYSYDLKMYTRDMHEYEYEKDWLGVDGLSFNPYSFTHFSSLRKRDILKTFVLIGIKCEVLGKLSDFCLVRLNAKFF